MSTDTPFSQLVVIGASAGGIDALSELVSTLPADFPAPIVVAQHLDPNRPSALNSILARRSTLPVRTVADHEPLAPGVVFVVPSNRHVSISDSAIELLADTRGRPKPSVDLLLSSAAEVYGEKLIAVILTGTGSDGAAGAYAVKKAGGTVVIQNPETASFSGMPRSLAPSTVDIVADLERIGPLLKDLLAGVAVPTCPADERALGAFLARLRERNGIDFSSYKLPTIERRLQRRIAATGSRDLAGYLRYLEDHPEEYEHLIGAFLIKVTEFFRDPELFAYLRDTVLPELIAAARRRGNELRIWSAGCATGEEAYALAILVCELLGDELDEFTVRIFATDLDEAAVSFARRGVYHAAALTGLPEELLARYFTAEEDGSYQVKKRVRVLTIFGQHDLGQRAPFPRIDLILCRNVLIYFAPELQQRTLRLFAYSLRDGGFLALGRAETVSPLEESFEVENKGQNVYRRQGERLLTLPAQAGEFAPLPSQRQVSPPRLAGGLSLTRAPREPRAGARLTESALLQLPVGVVTVDRRCDIRAINALARRYLSIHGPAIGEDVVHLVQGVPHLRLRTAIDTAFREGALATLEEVAIAEVATGEPRFFQFRCQPQRAEGDGGPVEAVAIAITDITAAVRARQDLERQVQEAGAELRAARQELAAETARQEELIGRLVETNRQLLEANQELTGMNEELRATNEQFLVSTEEAQATTEEVETLNEELETVNEELQATIEELNTTNDDLQARSTEMQELARVSEEERARLAAMLASIGDAVLVVDAAGSPVLTNDAYARIVAETGAEFAARDESGRLLPPDASPQARAARGESFNMEFTVAVPDGARRWFEARGRPIRDGAGRPQGGVVVIRDITERSLHRLQDEFLALASHELRTPLTPIQSYLQMLIRALGEPPADPRARRYAESALTQTRRLARLVSDLLDVTRLQHGKYVLALAPVDLDALVARAVEVARTLAAGQTIALRRENEGGGGEGEGAGAGALLVNGDAERLEQVLLNLLTNAITYAPNTERIDLWLRRAGDVAEIEVQDYGHGIAAADLPHLFSRFYQVARPDRPAQRGLGLGLFIAKEIVTAHGGTIAVASVEGEGTTFTVRLPLPRDVEERSGEGTGGGAGAGGPAVGPATKVAPGG